MAYRAVLRQITGDVGNEVLVLNLADNQYHCLGGVAAEVWRHLKQPRTERELLAQLLSHFEVDEVTCRTDLTQVLAQLSNAGLIERVAHGQPGEDGVRCGPPLLVGESEGIQQPAVRQLCVSEGHGTSASPPQMCREMEVLFWCLKQFLADRFPGAVSSPGPADGVGANDVDWQLLMGLADGHGVLPQLHLTLQRHGLGWVPSQVADDLAARVREHALASLRLGGELLSLTEALRQAGVSVLPFKGPVLAQSLYGDITHRQYTDLDLLLRWSDVPQAMAVLYALGYSPYIQVESPRQLELFRFGCEFPMVRDADGVAVELRWHVVPPYHGFKVSVEELRTNAERWSLGTHALLALSPVDRALVLAVHGTRHCWERVAWALDFACLVVKYPRVYWEEVEERAKACGVQRRLTVAIGVAARLFGVVPETSKLTLAQPAVVRRSVSQIFDALAEGGAAGSRQARSARFQSSTLDCCKDSVRFWWGLCTTPNTNDWQAVPLPEKLFWLYRVVHPLRLVARRIGWRKISKFLPKG